LLLIRQLLDGTLLADQRMIRNIPYILFITGLAILYITNSATAEKNRREAAALSEELKELRYQYISTKSGVMYLSNPSQISKKLKDTDIRENTVPPVKIFIPPTPKK
ncbi:MAG: FtsL-like putative cell division protein, partial [Bacteroidales bacterium]